MSQFNAFAAPGTIPHPGEVWRAVGGKSTLLTLHLLEADRVRPLLPPGLRLRTPLPGRTLGGTLLTCYGPGSTLEYHEFGVVAGWVRCGRRSGFYLSHLYVDSAASVEGGRRMGYPKEPAAFEWTEQPCRHAEVRQGDERLCSLDWRPRGRRLRFPLVGATLSRKDERVFRFRHRVSAEWCFAQVSLEIPNSSPLAALGLGRPLVALSGVAMNGALGLDYETLHPDR